MIAELVEKLGCEGLFDPRDTPYFANYQRHLKIYYCPAKAPGVFVKISAGPEARFEHLALRRFQHSLSGHIPMPLKFVENNDHCAIACRMLQHRRFAPKDILDRRLASQLSLVFRNLTVASDKCDWTDPVATDEIVALFEQRMGALSLPFWSLAYMQNAARRIYADLPRVPQHGDMLAINLGIDSGRVIVFDWEDYGKLDFCGCDLATLLFSIGSVFKSSARDMLQPADLCAAMDSAVISDFLVQIGVPKTVFVRYYPYYLFSFLYLKHRFGYGQQIFNTMSAFLRGMFASQAWQSLLMG